MWACVCPHCVCCELCAVSCMLPVACYVLCLMCHVLQLGVMWYVLCVMCFVLCASRMHSEAGPSIYLANGLWIVCSPTHHLGHSA